MQYVHLRLARARSEQLIREATRSGRSKPIHRRLRRRLGKSLIDWGEKLSHGEPRVA